MVMGGDNGDNDKGEVDGGSGDNNNDDDDDVDNNDKDDGMTMMRWQ